MRISAGNTLWKLVSQSAIFLNKDVIRTHVHISNGQIQHRTIYILSITEQHRTPGHDLRQEDCGVSLFGPHQNQQLSLSPTKYM